ncbi:hypothetical protein IFVP69_C1150459 [Vibrio parahaemolyticus]
MTKQDKKAGMYVSSCIFVNLLSHFDKINHKWL